MKGVIFGAGNIGRGFIGALFSQAGMEVTFIDVSPVIIERMNKDKEYPLHIVGEEEKIITIKNVCAVNGNDREAAVAAILEADIAATCVGANAIKYIIPNLSAGVRARVAEGKKPLNLLICENLMDADEACAYGLVVNLLTLCYSMIICDYRKAVDTEFIFKRSKIVVKKIFKNCKSKKVLLIDFCLYNIKYISVSLFTNNQINQILKYIENSK